jgi:hypothetical protein
MIIQVGDYLGLRLAGQEGPAHVYAKTCLTAPLSRIQWAPIGRMARTERQQCL